MSATTWKMMEKFGWRRIDIDEVLSDFGLTFVRMVHYKRTQVGSTSDHMIYANSDGSESQWDFEKVYCPTHKCNTTIFGEACGLGVYEGACGCMHFLEGWLDPK